MRILEHGVNLHILTDMVMNSMNKTNICESSLVFFVPLSAFCAGEMPWILYDKTCFPNSFSEELRFSEITKPEGSLTHTTPCCHWQIESNWKKVE